MSITTRFCALVFLALFPLAACAADLPLAVGDKVIIAFAGEGYLVTILSIEKGGKLKVGFVPESTEVVPKSSVKAVAAKAGTLFKAKDHVLVLREFRVYPGTINYGGEGSYRVDYDDAEEGGSETVAADRVLSLIPKTGFKLGGQTPQVAQKTDTHTCRQIDNLGSIKWCGGACTNIRKDAQNCGYCGRRCGSGQWCADAACHQ